MVIHSISGILVFLFLKMSIGGTSKCMVLINFVPISSGGGLQNAKSFLHFLRESDLGFPYLIVCSRRSGLFEDCKDYGLPCISVPGTKIGRLKFELFSGFKLIEENGVKVIFTLFGSAPLRSKGCYSISGFAYSNIINSEVKFWNYLPIHKRLMKSVVDYFRLRQALRSDEIILETEYLVARSRSGIFKDKSVKLIEMAPGAAASARGYSKLVLKGEKVDLLYLCGAQPNKRVHLLAEIVALLNDGERDYRIITTIPEGKYLEKVLDWFKYYGVAHCIKNIGEVPTHDVGNVLDNVSGVINIALLESFSNNWVEAWASGRPLIATDADWARSSCGKGAVFVDPWDPQDAAERIDDIFSSQENVDRLVEHGYRNLEKLPSPEERFGQYIGIIEEAYEKLT